MSNNFDVKVLPGINNAMLQK